MGPAYVVINRPQRPEGPTFAIAGISSKLLRIEPIELNGSPLPLIVQCMPGDILDLEPITEIIEQLPVDAFTTPEKLVRAIVAEIESEERHILPHVHVFYGIISSYMANKYIAVDFPELKFLETEDQTLVYHTFRTFVDAFIYVLAGGNENLEKWCLTRYLGTEPAGATRKMSIPPSMTSPRPISAFFASMTSKAKGLTKKGREKARDDDVSVLALTESFPTAGPSVPAESRDQPASGSSAKETSAAWKKEFTPVHIVPPDYVAELVDRALPFIHSGAQRQLVYTSSEAEVQRLNGPYSFSRHDDLPPFIIYYLRTHGWDDRMVEIVTIAHMCQGTLRGFLAAMSRENMPLAEASFLWHTLQHMPM